MLKILIVSVQAKERKILKCINPFQPSVTFHIETSYSFLSVKQMTGFYMK